MLISDSHKFIFIHNPKVAGSSIARALAKFSNMKTGKDTWSEILKKLQLLPSYYPGEFPWHISAKELRKKIQSKSKFAEYYKFGFVRDPWDLQLSLYTFMLKLKDHDQHRLIRRMKNFDEYIDWRIHSDRRLQKDYFYDGDELLVNFVGKFESLTDDFNMVCARIGVAAELPHINVSRSERNLSFYSQKTIDLIHEAFYPDVVAFGYTKPQLDDLVVAKPLKTS